MLELGTLLVLTGALCGVSLLAWLVPDVEPDGTRLMGLSMRHHKGPKP
jgi:hypothetical protein